MASEPRDMEDQVFARRMAHHMRKLADQADQLAVNLLHYGPGPSPPDKLKALAADMRALSRIMENEALNIHET